MQSLLASKFDLLFLTYLFNLECNHPIVRFCEKEMQNQRHEVCLKFIGLEYWSNEDCGIGIADCGFEEA
jgi:hypothetical protein